MEFPVIFSTTDLSEITGKIQELRETGEVDLVITTNRPFDPLPINPDYLMGVIGELGTEPRESMTLVARLLNSSLYELRYGQIEKDMMLRGKRISKPRILFLVLDPWPKESV